MGWKKHLTDKNVFVDQYGDRKNFPPFTLDWLHECEDKLDYPQRLLYVKELELSLSFTPYPLANRFITIHTTADQRFRALYRTVKL